VPSVRTLFWRYRIPLLALVVSAAIHAAIISGVTGQAGVVEEPSGAFYSATLEGATVVDTDAGASAPKPAPRPKRSASRPRPKAPAPKPENFLAQAPAPEIPPPAPEPEAAPDLPPEPDLPPPPETKPEVVALAQPAVPVKALEPEPFPTRALPSHLKITYALTSAFADGKATYEWERDGDN
jgi:hypothetical protein